MLERLRRNLRDVRSRIQAAGRRSPHAADHVDLVVVTKAAPPSLFPLLAEAGVVDVGENRVQAALRRRPQAPPAWRWHGIGHLQRNKARRAVEVFDVFHALDSVRLADRLEQVLLGAERSWPVYIEVNAAADPAKGGACPEETVRFLQDLARRPHLRVLGLMTMARLEADEAETRAAFATLRHLRDEAVRRGVGESPPQGLSMGMTADFEWAVEEGATVVRVGTAVFEGVGSAPAADARAEESRP